MGQSKKGSLLEAVTNTLIGLSVTMIFSPVINKACGINASVAQMTYSAILFTFLSIARGYLIRRISNYYQNKKDAAVLRITKDN